MVTVKFDVYSTNKGTIESSILPLIREKLSVVNKDARFVKKLTGRDVPRLYCITLGGKFDIGIFATIKNIIKDLPVEVKFEYTPAFRARCAPQLAGFDQPLPSLGLPPYDYQESSVRKMLKFGRGNLVIGTGGGKTFIMALLAKAVRKNTKLRKVLIIVPTLQLVEQTYTDFIDYGYDKSTISRWSGGHDFQDTDIIVANTSIMQSKLADLKFLSTIDVLMVDEVHILKKSNGINKIIDKIPTANRFGFTGTMPEEVIDQWNVMGKIGPILYTKASDSLREGKFISECKIDIIKVNYNNASLVELHKLLDSRVEKYLAETDFIIDHAYRNHLICKTSIVARGNSLIMVDRIVHGETIRDMLGSMCDHKKIYFIQGDVGVKDREKVRDIMENEEDVICVAISKIFSTGINIKNIHNIIFATPGKAKVKLIQSIGRGLRLHAMKKILRVFDFADDLHYSNRHLLARVKLYASEKLKYDIRNIQE